MSYTIHDNGERIKKVFQSVHAEPDHITIRPVSGARDLATPSGGRRTRNYPNSLKTIT